MFKRAPECRYLIKYLRRIVNYIKIVAYGGGFHTSFKTLRLEFQIAYVKQHTLYGGSMTRTLDNVYLILASRILQFKRKSSIRFPWQARQKLDSRHDNRSSLVDNRLFYFYNKKIKLESLFILYFTQTFYKWVIQWSGLIIVALY